VHLSAQQWGPFIGGRGSTGGWLGTARTPCVSAVRGAGAALAWAAGYGMLQELTGAFAGGEMVWHRGEQARAASAVVCPLLHGPGQRGLRARGGWRDAALGRLGQAGSLPGEPGLHIL
jgi:hypothetical protein